MFVSLTCTIDVGVGGMISASAGDISEWSLISS